jgi:hypothetical protein
MGWIWFAIFILSLGLGIMLLAYGDSGEEKKHIVCRVLGLFFLAIALAFIVWSMFKTERHN